MSPRIPLPDSIEAITGDWLSRAVSTRFPDSRANAVEIVDSHSGTTGRVQLRVDWNAESHAPSALFGKLAPTDPIQRQMVSFTDMGRREARFYTDVAADESLPIRAPRPIWSGWSEDDPSAYFMLLEDLEVAGCEFPSSRNEDSRRSEEGMIDTFARLHGHFWESPRFDEDLSWIDPPMRSPIGPQLVGDALSAFGSDMPEAFRELARLYIDHTDALCDRLDAGPATLTHGDSHVGNSFIDGDEVGLLDWACTCRAPGIRDVSYYLCNSVPTALRRERERSLLDRYLAGLEAAGGVAPSFEEAWRQYRRLATASWIAATATAAAGSRMQSVDIGLRALERANQAIVDLDTVALLREELAF